jgi:homospermidine synthase
MKSSFKGRVLLLGSGAVSQCFQALLFRHLDCKQLTVMDMIDARPEIASSLASGAEFVQHQLTKENLAATLEAYLGRGDLLIDLAWNIDTGDLIEWCQAHDVLYINTSVEVWNPYHDLETTPPTERTLYARHMALRKRAAAWSKNGSTAVIEHGANPGLVSHWTKVALEDITQALLRKVRGKTRQQALQEALDAGDWARLAMLLDVKVIHISERDTQITDRPKTVGEFVNTWSVEGFCEEGIAPAELGWGTHERWLPSHAHKHLYGSGNQICLSQMGMNTWVRSWVPEGGEILGMIIRHGEAFTISDYLTVWEEDKPLYRPTVHYAYLPCDAALASLVELRMNNYKQQSRARIMNDEITGGADELGVLLLGHELNGWWVGSQLSIEEARRLVPQQNATTLQVAASLLGALMWMIRNPREGLRVPDELPHREILDVANPYLGPCPSVQTHWTPLKNRYDPFAHYGRPRPHTQDIWQFSTFLVET